jgi:KDO2-lipid IV(A) lauroyltransferase
MQSRGAQWISRAATAKLVNRLKYAVYKMAALAVQHLPGMVSYAVAGFAGRAAYFLTPSRRRAVAANLRHVLGPNAEQAEIQRTTLSIYQSVARYYVDLLSVPRLDVGRLRHSRIHVEGYEHLSRALEQGTGVILATVHYGCPELSLQAARAWGIEILVLTEPLDPPELSKLFDRLRASHGHRFLTASLTGAKEAIRTLRRGGAVLLAVDRDIQGHGIEVPFFGVPARMPLGAVELSRRAGSPIVPAISRRLKSGSAVITLGPPIQLQADKQRSDTATNVARVLKEFEAPIRADPGQWLVLERLWDRVGDQRRRA